MLPDLPSLRGRRLWAAVRGAFVRTCAKPDFRIAHFSVQGHHLHLICEADGRSALSRGIQAFKVSVARRVNRACGGRTGTVFAERYHAKTITTPTQCRAALAYVLCNQRHHAHDDGASFRRGRIDPCSSAAYFGGWTLDRPQPWTGPPARTDEDHLAPVAVAETWLLHTGWQRGGGPISPDHVPALRGAAPLPQW